MDNGENDNCPRCNEVGPAQLYNLGDVWKSPEPNPKKKATRSANITRLKQQHIETAIAVVSCHISDLNNGIDPNEPETVHSRDEELEDKIRDLVLAILEAARFTADIDQ